MNLCSGCTTKQTTNKRQVETKFSLFLYSIKLFFMQLITLTAQKVKETEGNYKGFDKTVISKDGEVYATIPAFQPQPRKGQKTIVLNCWTYALTWEN